MSATLHIDGTDYHSASGAAKQLGYTKEYLLMLAKQQKIPGQKINNKWYIDVIGAAHYFTHAEDAKKIRHQEISKLRKEELSQRTTAQTLRRVRTERINRRAGALLETAAILIIGLTIGTTGYFGTYPAQQAAVSSTGNFIDSFALSLYRLVVPVPRSIPVPESAMVVHEDADMDEGAIDGGLLPVMQEETTLSPERTVQNAFSDTVRVAFDAENPEIVVVTPVFKDGAGDEYRFLLTPVATTVPVLPQTP